MQLILHDLFVRPAVEPQPELRPAIDPDVRVRWVRALYDCIQQVPPDKSRFTARLTVGTTRFRLCASRHGAAWAAVWSTGATGEAVAASILLVGRDSADDTAAVRALEVHEPPLGVEPADIEAISELGRPCLGTLYLDVRRYNDSSIELLATALALAALHGPDGTLSVPREPSSLQSARAKLSTPGGEADHGSARALPINTPAPSPFRAATGPGDLKVRLVRERLQLVMEMVSKKSSAAIKQIPGNHFRVYAPAPFLRRPSPLGGPDIFDQMKDTYWTVLWHDGRRDVLAFAELLAFLDQVVECERAYESSVLGTQSNDSIGSTSRKAVGPGSTPKNANVWKQPGLAAGELRTVRAKGRVDLRKLAADETIRHLLGLTVLEQAPSEGVA